MRDGLLDRLDRGDFERDLGLVRLDDLYSSIEILPPCIRGEQIRKSTGKEDATTL